MARSACRSQCVIKGVGKDCTTKLKTLQRREICPADERVVHEVRVLGMTLPTKRNAPQATPEDAGMSFSSSTPYSGTLRLSQAYQRLPAAPESKDAVIPGWPVNPPNSRMWLCQCCSAGGLTCRYSLEQTGTPVFCEKPENVKI